MHSPTLVAAALAAALLALPVAAQSTSQEAGAVPAVSTEAATDAQTAVIVDAAEAFMASLEDSQREAVLFAWEDDAQRTNWSNFPTGLFQRAGLRWGDLTEIQRESLISLLGTVLSEDGLRMVQEQMASDEVLKAEEGGGAGGGLIDRLGSLFGGGGPGDLIFGSDEYYVSFVGEPSESEPWMLQFGGHHLGINATVVGPNVTLAPSLTGGQPVRFTLNGQAIDIVVDEVTAAGALMASLSEEQLGEAVRSETRSDLVLGPGHDGETLQPEGLMGADMTVEQRTLLLALIETRLGMLNADDLATTMASIEENLDATAFAWFGPTDDPASAYWRVTGPKLVLEFSPQEMGGDAANHLHNMYRDPTNDYGAAWAALP